jgi:hypothetical protein
MKSEAEHNEPRANCSTLKVPARVWVEFGPKISQLLYVCSQRMVGLRGLEANEHTAKRKQEVGYIRPGDDWVIKAKAFRPFAGASS